MWVCLCVCVVCAHKTGLGDMKEKSARFGSNRMWEEAENELRWLPRF